MRKLKNMQITIRIVSVVKTFREGQLSLFLPSFLFRLGKVFNVKCWILRAKRPSGGAEGLFVGGGFVCVVYVSRVGLFAFGGVDREFVD